MPEIDLLLNTIEEHGTPERAVIGRFMLDVLALIEPKLSVLAVESLGIGRRFASGLTPESSVRESLLRCWTYVDEHRPYSEIGMPDGDSVRAVICALHSLVEDDEDFVDSLSFFLNLVNRIEPHPAQEIELLYRHFVDFLDHGRNTECSRT